MAVGLSKLKGRVGTTERNKGPVLRDYSHYSSSSPYRPSTYQRLTLLRVIFFFIFLLVGRVSCTGMENNSLVQISNRHWPSM